MTTETGTSARRRFGIVLLVSLALLTSTMWATSQRSAADVVQEAGRVPLEAVPAAQAALFADGRISASERNQAFVNWIDCIEAEGFAVTSAEMRYFGESLAVEDPDDVSGDLVHRCREAHYAATTAAFRAQLEAAPGFEAVRQQHLDSCLETGAAGVEFTKPSREHGEALGAICNRDAAERAAIDLFQGQG